MHVQYGNVYVGPLLSSCPTAFEYKISAGVAYACTVLFMKLYFRTHENIRQFTETSVLKNTLTLPLSLLLLSLCGPVVQTVRAYLRYNN